MCCKKGRWHSWVDSTPIYSPKGGQRFESQHLLPVCSTRARLFESMTEEKYRTIYMFHMGSILQITLILINILKVYLHINLYQRPLTTSKLDQFVTAKYSMVINNHTILILDTTRIFEESRPRAITYSLEDKPLLYVDISRTQDNLWK
jgi:hypothetical protein